MLPPRRPPFPGQATQDVDRGVVLEERPAAAVTDALGGRLRGGPQPDHVRAGCQGLPVGRPAEHPAAGRQDDRLAQPEGPLEAVLLGIAEALFSPFDEQHADAASGVGLDPAVEVDVAAPSPGCHEGADGRLAGAHAPDEGQVGSMLRDHGLRLATGPLPVG